MVLFDPSSLKSAGMSQQEEQLRALVLILIIIASTLIIGSTLFIASPTLGFLGFFATLLFGLFSVYNHYFELPDGISDTVHEVQLNESGTAGTRPALGQKGFDLDVDDFVLSELPPKRVAQVICHSPNWQSDGHGGYSTWWRSKLRRLFHSDVFSSRTFEITLLGVTLVSFVVLCFIFLSFLPDNLTMAFVEPLTRVYPSNQPIERTEFVTGVSIVIAFIGTAYFTIKSESTCPVCHSPFALASKKQYFKPENREVITVTQDGNSEKKEVTYGVHIFHCESCGSWHVPTKRWERSLEARGL